jgi:hypothetical protein
VPSIGSQLDLIEPGNHQASYFWHKVNGSHLDVGGAGVRMPRFRDAWSEQNIERLAAWIDHQGFEEVCGDDLDNDCDGRTDEFCPVLPGGPGGLPGGGPGGDPGEEP